MKEDDLQIAVFDYLRLQYPKALPFHPANERKTTKQHGAKLKRMGVLAGLPDVMILDFKINKETNKLIHTGLAIELKIKPNKPTDKQLFILSELRKRGWQTHVCYDFDKAKKIIDNYLR